MTYADVLRQLLPPNAYDAFAPNLSAELLAVGNALAAAQQSGDLIFGEMRPQSANLSISDWNRNNGLPDPCASGSQTIEQMQNALSSKVCSLGGQSIAYFLNLAESLGYSGATITEFPSFSCNSNCNAALNSQNDLFVWQLNLISGGGLFQMTCDSNCNSGIQSWGDEVLQCRFNRLKPVHTQIIFNFT